MHISATLTLHIAGLGPADLGRIVGSLQPPTRVALSPAPPGLNVTTDDATLSAGELAKVLGLSLTALRGRSHRGSIPAPIKVGGRVRWRASDIDAWLAQKARATK